MKPSVVERTLRFAATRRRALALAAAFSIVALVPPARAGEGFNIDFGVTFGIPASAFWSASGQEGVWNQAGLGTTPLVDLSGAPSGASVSVSASDETGAYGGTPTNDVELLLNDNFYVSFGGVWNVAVTGLSPGRYQVFFYASRNPQVPTGNFVVEGTLVASIPGSTGSTLVEGTSWVSVDVALTDDTLSILGTDTGLSGLAGLQVVPIAPRSVNVDLGQAFGVPATSYGAASGQAGYWNKSGFPGSWQGLLDVSAQDVGDVYISAASPSGNNGSPPTNDDELLLNDHIVGAPWTCLLHVPLGNYEVYLYAPSSAPFSTGLVYVHGTQVPSLPGHTGSVLVEGVSWAKATVTLDDKWVYIHSPGFGNLGLAGVQLVPVRPGGVNIDFGTAKGLPAASYGAASGQVGPWTEAGLGRTDAVDASGAQAGTSVTVVAGSEIGSVTGTPANDDEFLLNDNFYSSGGGTWKATLVGLAEGDHLVFLYAPSNIAVPTGDMLVGGVPVASLPGHAGASLFQGTSWEVVEATAPDGVLAISGAGPTYSGLAGLQVVPVPDTENYCSPGISASGCTATLASAGTPSATAPSGFVLSASSVEGAKDGLFFFGANGRQANPWGNGTSYQCVVPPVRRAGLLSGSGTTGQCNGSFSQDLNALWCPTCPKPQKSYGAGAVVQAQLWYRDPFNTSNQTTSLSDAIEFMVRP